MLSWHWAEIGSAFSRDYRQNRVRTRYLIGHTEQLDYKHQNCSPLNSKILRKKFIILIDLKKKYDKKNSIYLHPGITDCVSSLDINYFFLYYMLHSHRFKGPLKMACFL